VSLSSTSIRRPVLSIVISLIIIIFGIVAFTFLEVREYPSVDPPVVTVTTSYTGANSEIIETQLTEPLEQSLNGIEGIKSMSSQSREGLSIITVEFNLGKDLETAANDVRDRVSRAQKLLPKDVDNPVIEKSDADNSPIIFLYVQSDSKSILEVNDFATNVIKERIQTIPGISSVSIQGERKYAMRMWLDPSKLAAYKLTPIDIQNSLLKQNIDLPSGRIEGNNTELTIRTYGRLINADEFNKLIIKRDTGGSIVRFEDVGYAVIGAENERNAFKKGGLLGIGILITAQPGANALEISNELKKRIVQLKKDIPPEYSLEIGFDASDYIRTTIKEVESTIFIAFGLVILIIFLFLRDWRSTIIPILAIPTSIISAFFIMYLFGFSINVLTLVGIILAIGLVVDDAIVVLENIYAKIEEGIPPLEAALKGSKEIYFAIISTTMTLAAVFLPILFLQGISGRLFREFGVVIAGSVLVSALVALTLTPMLSSRLLKSHHAHNKFYNLTEPFFEGINNWYKNSLSIFLKFRWLSFAVIIAAGLLIYFVGGSLKSELSPVEDRSNIRVQLIGPEGSSFEYTEKYADELTKMLIDSIPEIATPLTNVAPGTSVNTANINLYLKPPETRKRSQQQIYQQISRMVNSITGLRSSPSQPPTIGGRGGQPVQFVIQAHDFDSLKSILPAILEETSKQPELQFVDVNLKVNKPELSLTIDRDKAATLGVSIDDIANTLQIAFGSQRFGYFIKEGKQYQILGQLNRQDRNDPYDLKNISIRNLKGDLLQLDNLVSLKEQSTPTTRYRYNRYVSATISAGLTKGYTLGDGLIAMQRVSDKLLPDDFSTALSGQSKDFVESSSSLMFTFMFAIIIIFLVLATQFESFLDPLIILLTVPLALTGALLTLWYFNMTLNIFSQIGIIMLIGLVTKNAILIVEFANQQRDQGLDKIEAVKLAAAQRFRPIVMTSLCTILGALPIAIGAGAGSRVSLGVAVIGGLLFSTFLTLFVVPSIYTYLSSHKAIPEEKI
jgi:multidrug efflux pump